MRLLRRPLLSIALLVIVAAGLTGCVHGTQPSAKAPTALDTYVHAPDPHYSFKLANTLKGDGYTAYVLSMTSQQFRTEKEVNRPIWTHWLTIVKPDKVVTDKGLLVISGGSVDKPVPDKVDGLLAGIAVSTHSVVTQLQGIPNEPLVFAGETRSRTEDGIIAYTWDKFLRTGDSTWPLRLPMTKAAVRAMDTVTAFMGSEQGGKTAVKQFVVTGASKRGWTTWTTAAEDKRVIAIAPIVINMLNIEPSFRHHYRAYGRWAPAVGDYEAQGLMDWVGTPEYRELMKIEEPYQYRDRMTMPKYIINATGDQFFLPDSTKFYYDDLPGEKLLRMVPNADHGLRDTNAQQSLAAFYQQIITDAPRPKYSWKMEKSGAIRVTVADKPKAVKLWQATNPKARDFRVETLGKVWTSTDLAPESDGSYVGRVPKPAKGWTCFMVELSYDTGASVPLVVTTPVRVVPDTLPFKEFKPKATPKGYLSSKPAAGK